jgi:hypothetical protein
LRVCPDAKIPFDAFPGVEDTDGVRTRRHAFVGRERRAREADTLRRRKRQLIVADWQVVEIVDAVGGGDGFGVRNVPV